MLYLTIPSLTLAVMIKIFLLSVFAPLPPMDYNYIMENMLGPIEAFCPPPTAHLPPAPWWMMVDVQNWVDGLVTNLRAGINLKTMECGQYELELTKGLKDIYDGFQV
jgi:hypothetical protein